MKTNINYRIDYCLDRDEICDIVFYSYKIQRGELKITQKNVDELVRCELYACGRSTMDDLGYYRSNCVNNGELIELNEKIIDFVYNKYKLNK
jgi:hypothetical protein